jgi:hypothetical protein
MSTTGDFTLNLLHFGAQVKTQKGFRSVAGDSDMQQAPRKKLNLALGNLP